jgi:glycosyltransferase involved in cell wall biosynthesis
VLLTDQCGFDVIAEHGGSVVPASADGIKSGLIEMLSAPANLKARGELLRDFVRTQYLWESVVQSYLVLYERMTGKRTR